jgi:hypothetical protein
LAKRSGKIEERELAKLLDEAIEQRRRPTVLGLPARDIFFLLDETAIRDTFGEHAPSREPYPGHEILQELIAETGEPRQRDALIRDRADERGPNPSRLE